MRPLPKLPTSRSPLKKPKSAGARASPHGELSRPLEATRRSRLPAVSKAFTNPWPSPGTSSCLSASDRKSTRLNSSHGYISYAVFCLKKKNDDEKNHQHAADVAVLNLT